MEEEKKGLPSETELFKDLGIDPNKLPEDLQKIYKSMQADYTRKTQTLAEMRKEWTAKDQEYAQKFQNLGALEQEVGQWREWYKSLEEQVGGDDKAALEAKDKELREKASKGEPDANAALIKRLEDEVNSLKGALGNVDKTIGESQKRVDRMFNYQSQLTELAGKYPKLDKSKLLDHALKSGQTDLEKAYKELYYDDLLESEVQKRLKEEVAKIRTDGIHSPAKPMFVRPSGSPLSFEEATEQIVKERIQQGKM